MLSTLYFDILEKLYNEYGVNIDADITQLMDDHFVNTSLEETYWNLKEDKINDYLNPMKKQGHINYKTTRGEPKNGFPMGDITVIANITADGMMFYYQKTHIDLVINANKLAIIQSELSIKSYKQTNRNTAATFILAIVSFLVSLFTYFKNDETALSVDKLREQIKNQKQEQIKPSVQTTFEKAIPRKP